MAVVVRILFYFITNSAYEQFKKLTIYCTAAILPYFENKLEKKVQKCKVSLIGITYTLKFAKKIILHISLFRVISFQSEQTKETKD